MSSSPTQFVDVAAFLSWLAQRDHVELQAWVRTALRHIGDLFEESQEESWLEIEGCGSLESMS